MKRHIIITIILLCISMVSIATKRALLVGISDYPAIKLKSAGGAKNHGFYIEEDSPFFFKDVDFDGKKEILFRAGGYHGTYIAVYKIINQRHVGLMIDKPFNNFVYAFRESLNDDSLGIYFDYQNKTITINEQLGASGYNHDVYLRNPKVSSILNPMNYIERIHTEEGAMLSLGNS